jgi:hypothetical protein
MLPVIEKHNNLEVNVDAGAPFHEDRIRYVLVINPVYGISNLSVHYLKIYAVHPQIP